MTEKEIIQIRGFINEKDMAQSVHDLLMRTFMRKEGGDVQMLAAKMLAIQLLEEAWVEMERYKNIQRKNSPAGNPGV